MLPKFTRLCEHCGNPFVPHRSSDAGRFCSRACYWAHPNPNIIDMTGKRIGRWLVLQESSKRGAKGQAYWDCRCDCGTEKTVLGSSLRNGSSTSCGCLSQEILDESRTTHGLSDTPEHRIWIGMRARCNNPNDTKYRLYGGRGIQVCERWNSFENFLADMGPRPSPNHSIDRVNGDSGYSPENCRWATATEQARNSSRNRFVTYQGETKTVGEWAEITGIPYSALHHRIHSLSWPLQKAFTTPVRKRCVR